MGAMTFGVVGTGSTAKEAFANARANALYEYGHGGYTGSIAEKSSFTFIALPEGADHVQYADDLIDACDKRIDDKWGPAGCIPLGSNKWYFFGWASC